MFTHSMLNIIEWGTIVADNFNVKLNIIEWGTIVADNFNVKLNIIEWGMVMIELQSYGSLGCLEDERAGLMKLKEAFHNPARSTALHSWGGGEERDCCKWERVVCDNATKRVSQLSLSQARYFGNHWFLDASLFLPFQELQSLSLADDALAGFKGVLNLTKLEVLDLRSNSFTEISSLDVMKSLKSLNLGNNDLNNSHRFKELTNLTKLEMLHLGDNGLMEIPSSIWALTSLKALSLRNNGLTGLLPLRGLCKLVNLQELDLSNNGFEGNLPSCLVNFISLRLLELSQNRFEGAIPSTLFPILKSLEYVSLSHNFFEGSFSFSSLANNSNLEVFELVSDNNGLKVETENPPWTPLFQLKFFRLSNCILNDKSRVLPSFLLNQFELRVIDLSHNSISGTIPMWLVANNTKLEFLNLANNSLTGPLTLHLNSTHLDMFWFDVSSNHIQGELPYLVGSTFPNLITLNVSSNLFQGSIPPSLGDLRVLDTLDLSNNNFSGQLPEHLVTGCVSLAILKLSNNSLQGKIPSWINSFSNLRVLLLGGNSFEGPIPLQLCDLGNISIIDLSRNEFSGSIPSCLHGIKVGNEKAFDDTFRTEIYGGYRFMRLHSYSYENQVNVDQAIPVPISISDVEEEVEFITKSRSETYKGNVLYFMSGIDLSWNKLTGPVPYEIGYLSDIHALNLSHNHLTGPIPESFSNLKQIESLDLCHNSLSGQIPLKLVELNYLSVFTVAYNNLSGRTPERKAQFATFDEHSYEGNSLLCGVPLERRCITNEEMSPPPQPSYAVQDDTFEVAFLLLFGQLMQWHL
ncbi:hypothetical protein RJ640_020405 [Escallonia rubra]|uniref:Leucine-rich repeat-containing N-terminal plant-type domain-containing protein n=1 Tax=Escallonia rubra TaxID=112253 RepID=A0AA88RB45_9ASTE|nr:hypothetical protein RJ640_020405 [Escallonia rubra]